MRKAPDALTTRSAGSSRLTVGLPRTGAGRPAALGARGAAVVLLALIGVFHLIEAPDHFAAQPYIGILFWVATAGAFVAALGIASGLRGAWILGATVAAATFAGMVLAATLGLPHFREDFSDSFAVPSLVVEGLYLVLYVATSASRRSVAAT